MCMSSVPWPEGAQQLQGSVQGRAQPQSDVACRCTAAARVSAVACRCTAAARVSDVACRCTAAARVSAGQGSGPRAHMLNMKGPQPGSWQAVAGWEVEQGLH